MPASGSDSCALLFLVHYSHHARKFLSCHCRPVHASIHCSGVDHAFTVLAFLYIYSRLNLHIIRHFCSKFWGLKLHQISNLGSLQRSRIPLAGGEGARCPSQEPQPHSRPFRPRASARPPPPCERKFRPLKTNLDWRYWFTVFSVQYEELLKFEELLFSKSVTVYSLLYYIIHSVPPCVVTGDWQVLIEIREISSPG